MSSFDFDDVFTKIGSNTKFTKNQTNHINYIYLSLKGPYYSPIFAYNKKRPVYVIAVRIRVRILCVPFLLVWVPLGPIVAPFGPVFARLGSLGLCVGFLWFLFLLGI